MKRITAPNREYTGKVGNVQFVDGQAETDDLAVINYCTGAGYTVEDVPGTEEASKTPSRSASKADWVAYAADNGMTEAEAEALTRDVLAERFLGPKQD